MRGTKHGAPSTNPMAARCCADLDALRLAALEMQNPRWPRCPLCQVELSARDSLEAKQSVAVKNYLLCHRDDVLMANKLCGAFVCAARRVALPTSL